MTENTGAMIAHFSEPARNSLVELATTHFFGFNVPGDEMHLTLVYIGEAADLGDDDAMEMGNILQSLSEKMAPMPASINGITRFLDNDPTAVVVNFDCPGLVTLRSFLMSQLRGQGIEPPVNHGFTPHITIAYLPADKPLPDVKFAPIPVMLDTITLAIGDKRQTFPLRGDVALSEAKNAPTKTKAEATYTDHASMPSERCRLCKHFIETGRCEIVEGVINPDGWCKYFEAKNMAGNLSEAGIYDVSISEDDLDESALTESVPEGAPSSDFADPPKGLYVGDAKHAALAVQAVTTGFRGNKAKARSDPGVKSRIATAIRKFYKGEQAKYYLDWLHSGKKPEKRPAAEMHMQEMYISAPAYSVADEARFPNVPTAPGVNLDTLMAARGDTNPVFVVRPLAILDEVSDNGLPYNQAILNDVYEQVISRRPVARRGHISQADKSSLFPPDDGYWIGAVMDSSVYGKPAVFGKCYVVPGETRDMVLSRSATGTALSNSLWGNVNFAEDGNGQLVPIGVKIESIDFVPEERAALQALGGEFVVTSEMTVTEANMTDGKDKEHEAAMGESIKALTPHELHEMMSESQRHSVAESHVKGGTCTECGPGKMYEMLSEAHRAHIAEMVIKEAAPEKLREMLGDKNKAVAEMFASESKMRLVPHEDTTVSETTLSEMKTISTDLAEAKRELAELRREKFEGLLDKAVDAYFAGFTVSTEKGKEGLATLKDTVRTASLAEMAGMDGGQVVANIAAATKTAWEAKKPLVEMFISVAGGPSAIIGNIDNGAAQAEAVTGYDPKTGRYDTDAAKSARAKANF